MRERGRTGRLVVMFETRHLTRRFGELVAVDDVSLEVPDGATVGFVGGNGAGKTTTMRMIMGLLGPDAGEVLWDGAPITAAERRRIGYMPEERGLYPKQRVLDQLVYLARLHGAGAAAARGRRSSTATGVSRPSTATGVAGAGAPSLSSSSRRLMPRAVVRGAVLARSARS